MCVGIVSACIPDARVGISSHYRWLWATVWLLVTEFPNSWRAISALNYGVISLVPIAHFLSWHFSLFFYSSTVLLANGCLFNLNSNTTSPLTYCWPWPGDLFLKCEFADMNIRIILKYFRNFWSMQKGIQ